MTKNSNIATLVNRVKSDPKDSFSKFALALELIKTQRNESAIVFFEDIIHNDPNYIGVYYHLGQQYFLIGDNKKAIAVYNKGIEVTTKLKDNHARTELETALITLQIETE